MKSSKTSKAQQKKNASNAERFISYSSVYNKSHKQLGTLN